MDAFEIRELLKIRERSGRRYLEFLRVPSLSVGVYHLSAGSTDPQTPHSEDEVYHVVRGRAGIRVGDEDHLVRPGSIVFVGARVSHAFHSIREDLDVLVLFAPAEGSGGPRRSASARARSTKPAGSDARARGEGGTRR